MSMLPIKPLKFDDGRTKQAFKDETDINKLLVRAKKAGTLSHLEQYQGQYGDFSNFDFFDAQLQLAKGREIFDALPGEIRKEFNQSPSEFFTFVNSPQNADKLRQLLPALAEPGRQNIDVSGKSPGGDASAPKGAETPPTEAQPAVVEKTPPAGSESP